ncbi:uncharacterized protein K452DRAFT_284046 [Aplosporella prunicola CBS 121167]|uniref:Uncharacterized protein n=1 Tax=Aplosporella prunicola CBS 121167 TaxID=1176127 RepID=A0A6A6BNJ9_9PEZI|nr:uncharacterized protein K452DRAFT_284046 [Aplosporella prunicola CBS 121167]KAF2145682.1 hypothetical protein K452DRAFT_284046 [Aplosporella prunicola CBS 121167]
MPRTPPPPSRQPHVLQFPEERDNQPHRNLASQQHTTSRKPNKLQHQQMRSQTKFRKRSGCRGAQRMNRSFSAPARAARRVSHRLPSSTSGQVSPGSARAPVVACRARGPGLWLWLTALPMTMRIATGGAAWPSASPSASQTTGYGALPAHAASTRPVIQHRSNFRGCRRARFRECFSWASRRGGG